MSRTTLKRPTGTVTAFAFDQGQGLSEHTAVFDARVQVIESEGAFTIAGKAFHLGAGETILLPANQPCRVLASSRFKMRLTMVRAQRGRMGAAIKPPLRFKMDGFAKRADFPVAEEKAVLLGWGSGRSTALF